MIGKTISHYKIIEELGTGGMGVVYKALDTTLDRFVALKFLPTHLSHNEEEKKRFIHEAKAASALDHPNICSIYEIDETEDGQMFIALACYEGESLKDKIDRGPLPVGEAIDIASQITQGLEKAHTTGIIHRDIKPANILVTQDGVVKIVDFGLAKLAGKSMLTKKGTTLGTIDYMSPEQARGDVVDHRTDIWAFGVVLYEMVTGQLPFKGDYDQAVIYAILNEKPAPITTDNGQINHSFEAIITKALRKNPDDRYQSMTAIGSDMEKIKRNLGTQSTLGKSINTEEKPSLAVLPFVNMSADAENEYFSDGITEDIINALSKIKEFHVAARTSTFSFKGEKIDVREIGSKLKVDTVLEGSVRKAGTRLRITAQLINVQDGYHLWSEQYDRVIADVFDIQDEITLAIVEALKVELLSAENIAVTKRYTDIIEAYNLYSKGRFYWNKMNTESFWQAIDHFRKAIALDPLYALAYAGLADAYTGLGDAGLSAISPKDAFLNAKEAVMKALEIDNDLAEAHASLAHLYMHDLNWSGAEQEFKRAIELNPNYATTYHMCAFYYALMKRHQEALNTIKKAQELDPVSLGINTDLGVIFYFNRQYDLAIAQYKKTLELDPGFIRAYVTLGSAYGKKGMYKKAIEMIKKAMELSADRAKIAALGRAYAVSGNTKEAIKIIDELKELSKKRYISPYCLALIYASMNEKDLSMEWLQKAYDEHVSELIYLKVDPYLDNLRSDPRFKELLKKMDL